MLRPLRASANRGYPFDGNDTTAFPGVVFLPSASSVQTSISTMFSPFSCFVAVTTPLAVISLLVA